eukprot:COSAG02_NODE_25409_length_659_cov_1.632143_1_plen_40_part_01
MATCQTRRSVKLQLAVFYKEPPTTEIYKIANTLSLHHVLP